MPDEKTKREMLTTIILKDVLDGVEYYFGNEGLEQVVNFASLKNRSRESNRVIDELELLYGTTSEEEE